MTFIKAKQALDIFINEAGTVSLVHPDVEDYETGETRDVIITIHPEDLEIVAAELLRLKEDFLQNEKEYTEAAQQELEN